VSEEQIGVQRKIIEPPALTAEHLSEARLFACRKDLILSIAPSDAHDICEIGVAYGDFSAFLIETLRPKRFVAADTFDMHLHEIVWGSPTAERFRGLTHLEYFKGRIAPMVDSLTILQGPSSETMRTLADSSLDLIYVDGAHDYQSVKMDAQTGLRKIKPTGTIIFNDYTLFDPFIHLDYGVVAVANEVVTQTEWRVVGFALQQHMFCDIALKRAPAKFRA
jgi:hypothetical protein